MARLVTMAPGSFVKIKQSLSRSGSRDPRKSVKDAHQARIVQTLIKQYGIGHSPELTGRDDEISIS